MSNKTNGAAGTAKKPIYKKVWFWLLIVVLVIGIGGALGSNGSSKDSSSSSTATKAVKKKKADKVPVEYQNALKKAETYSDLMHMSKQAIHDQLVSKDGEKFSEAAADYAMTHLKADWNRNALKKAKSYQEDQSMSKEAIKEQLTSEYGEKFTEEQADYAISHLPN